MWAQLLSATVGLWLMLSPSAFGYGPPLATSDWIVGPLIASFALTAAWEILHGVRWLNVPLGAWLVASPFLLGNESLLAATNHVGAGLLVVGLSFVRRRRAHRYGGGWKTLVTRTETEPGLSGRSHA